MSGFLATLADQPQGNLVILAVNGLGTNQRIWPDEHFAHLFGSLSIPERTQVVRSIEDNAGNPAYFTVVTANMEEMASSRITA